MMSDVKRIAEGLSDLEREWITSWQGPAGAAFNAIAGELKRKGLLVGELDWHLNQTGEAVRAHLTENSNG